MVTHVKFISIELCQNISISTIVKKSNSIFEEQAKILASYKILVFESFLCRSVPVYAGWGGEIARNAVLIDKTLEIIEKIELAEINFLTF